MAELFEYEQSGGGSLANMTLLSFCVEVENRVGMLGNICNLIARGGVNILKVESLDAENKNVILKLSVEIANYEQFEMITANLKKLSGVFEVTREIGAVES